MVECLNICLSKCQQPFAPNEKYIHLKCDQCDNNDNEEEYLALRTGVKIFLTTNEAEILEDSLKTCETQIYSQIIGFSILTIELIFIVFKELNQEVVDSVILAFNHGKHTLLADLLTLWAVLEGYVNKQKITRIGVSDIDTDLFISLYNNSIVSLVNFFLFNFKR